MNNKKSGKIKLLLFIFFQFSFAIFGNTQVIINEYSASNLHNIKDNYGKTEDWIELYNESDVDVNIGGWYLSDKKKKSGKWKIPQGTKISAKGFLLFWCSGRDEFKDGHYHTNFKLSQTTGKDKVILSNSSKKIIQKLDLEITLTEHSICRKTDGSDKWRICTMPTPKGTNNGSTQFKDYTEAPSMNKEAGFYKDKVLVSIENNEPNSVLRYTIDGKNVTNTSPIYTVPIELDNSTVIKARAFSDSSDILPGKMDFNTYFINEDYSLPVFSVASDDVETLANGDESLRPIGSLEYFNVEKKREATSFGSLNKHGQDSWILPHRSIDWISRDEMGYSKSVKAKLFKYSDRDSYQKFMFRNSGDDNYPANDDADHVGSTHIRDEYVQTLALEGGMHLDTRAVRRVILFLNGKYWGLYGMREKPVDNDFTKEYYDQDKYHIHYLTTWETTKAKYGGEEALNDWYEIRDFILNNDMSVEANYKKVKDNIDMISFIDYFIANMSVVAKDWLNYNTAWWKGTDVKGSHKKWGYLLWDMDATFDYYINYTMIPNDQFNAKPCDIDEISKSMDVFFGEGNNDTIIPSECYTIKNGSCPYSPDDTIFLKVIENQSYCCESEWDDFCQTLYDTYKNPKKDTCNSIKNGSCPYEMGDEAFQNVISFEHSCCSDTWSSECQEFYDYLSKDNGLRGNIGKHEKLLIKLRDESIEFRELYYARQADLYNTVFSCENMNSTLDRMLAVIEPEMPKQIERWGGTLTEWESNVDKLRSFVNKRCTYLNEGMTSCFDITGPFELTIDSEPEGVGEIKINTIDVPVYPWTGKYYGNMSNKLQAFVKDDKKNEYKFSHWRSKSGSNILPSNQESNIGLKLTETDTIIAVYKLINSTDNLNIPFAYFNIHPNPAKDYINIDYYLKNTEDVSFELFTILGEKLKTFKVDPENKEVGKHEFKIDTKSKNIKPGIYFFKMRIKNNDKYRDYTKKVIVTK